MSICINCNGKGRTCDQCGDALPVDYATEGDNDYCNAEDRDCWGKHLQDEAEYRARRARHQNTEEL